MLIEQIESDFKTAFKTKDEIAKSSLSNLKAALKTFEIQVQHALSDDEVIQIIGKKVKQHKDSIEGFLKGARQDLADFEQKQMTILQKYLPAAMGEEELRKIVSDVIIETQATVNDFGKVMKAVVEKVKGAADGNAISKLVKENLK